MSSKAVKAAARVMANPDASHEAKAMAATILAQSGAAPKVMAMKVSDVGRVLRDPKASKQAKSAAASALTHKVDRRFGKRRRPNHGE